MSTIKIQKVSITDLDTDAIVNAANSRLIAGSGVCGAIFKAAGADQLQDACNQYGHCDVGSAVITPGFRLKAKYIIHAVGPIWYGGSQGEAKLLYSAYQSSLELAVTNGCKSIGFPLISAGIYGYPLDDAWRKALQACRDFIEKHPESSIDVVFAVLNDDIIAIGKNTLKQVMSAGASSGNSGASSNALAQDWPVTAKPVVEHLQTGMGQVNAVYFHLTNEPNGYFSNWYPAAFVLDGIHYTSTEQYIMYQKCRLLGDIASAKDVLATNDVARQQKIGKQASGYNANVWAGQRQIVALRGLTAKFSQNEELKRRLLETGDAWLVECAKSDKIWACGRRLTDDRRLSVSEWDGTNILGFALMGVRERLK